MCKFSVDVKCRQISWAGSSHLAAQRAKCAGEDLRGRCLARSARGRPHCEATIPRSSGSVEPSGPMQPSAGGAGVPVQVVQVPAEWSRWPAEASSPQPGRLVDPGLAQEFLDVPTGQPMISLEECRRIGAG